MSAHGCPQELQRRLPGARTRHRSGPHSGASPEITQPPSGPLRSTEAPQGAAPRPPRQGAVRSPLGILLAPYAPQEGAGVSDTKQRKGAAEIGTGSGSAPAIHRSGTDNSSPPKSAVFGAADLMVMVVVAAAHTVAVRLRQPRGRHRG